MKTLVTGAAGFIGAHLCRRLAANGHEVVAMDVQPLPHSLSATGVRYLQTDLRRTSEWRSELRNATAVFHLASVHLQVSAREEEYRAVNVDAAVSLAKACSESGVRRLIHVSTVGIYGHIENPPASEDAPRRPTNPYERTKLEGEEAVAREAARSGLDVRILRPAWVFGPGCPRTAKLLRTIRKGRFFYIGSGTNWRHPVYIDDFVDAMIAASELPAGARQDHIVAGPTAMRLHEVIGGFAAAVNVSPPRIHIPRLAGVLLGTGAELAGRIVGKNPPFSRRSLAFFENDNAFDCSAAARDLNFVPKVGFVDGLRRTLADTTWPVMR